MSNSFESMFPETSVLLEKARGDVFPDYGVGIEHADTSWFKYAGCGPDSLFDLASLTKVLCTTTLCAIAEEKKLLAIDQSVQDFFPTFPDRKVKISHLLNHSAGFPDWIALHTLFKFDPKTTPAEARTRYEQEIIKSWLPEKFEKEIVYSDLGFMLLGWALENVTKTPLDALFQEWIAQPAGFESLQFLPASPDVVPTEDCPWRKRVLRGEVHDDNCYVLGGIAGHAGLFGNTREVVFLAKLWLKAYQGKKTIISPTTALKYWSFSHLPGSPRTLGWDGVTPGASSTGKYFSPKSKGHLGFTGTSLWIDPEKNLIVTLLTNRVHPTRENKKIQQFRPLFHDTLLEEGVRLGRFSK